MQVGRKVTREGLKGRVLEKEENHENIFESDEFGTCLDRWVTLFLLFQTLAEKTDQRGLKVAGDGGSFKEE